MNSSLVLSSAYFPNIEYFLNLITHNNIFIESKAHYQKQTYTNRCQILGANGVLHLSIPIKKGKSNKTSIDEVEISYDTDWQRLHFKSIESAYRSSAFYEYYIDAIIPFFNKKYQYLIELNTELLKTIINELELDIDFGLTTEYFKNQFMADDFRYNKKAIISINNPNYIPYYQVFNDKFTFQPNLSILDLLFNEGPNSLSFLKQ